MIAQLKRKAKKFRVNKHTDSIFATQVQGSWAINSVTL